ncbi:6-aminohexanoate hydrolase [Loktanella sp. D2R18]|uniref:serine hydrolase domain-containing protein n=1 Tax=Rhodobacterales TaxID=204455 RepID=UPI000DE8B614|nr:MULTISPECIES: serine hydrolase [Rhodobacterales]MDO6589291.1 serine hydrolase [Yoonia sp. 1_MG-2023]RBW45286.1 6-aminohexanoate hydrolase [Loktanella sp. D2R18]
MYTVTWTTVIAASVIAAVAIAKRTEIKRLRHVLKLFSADAIVRNFSHMDETFLADRLPATATATPLPIGTPMPITPGMQAWITARSITALVILKAGKQVFEDYYHGTGANDLRINWSVSKSYLSALFGAIMAEGAIDSIDDPVLKYAPTLAGTAYQATTIKDVLQMSSGLKFDEDYLAFFSDINRMGRVLALGGSMDRFAQKQKTSAAAPGERMEYVSIDTHVLGMVIRGATGRGVAELLHEKIIAPLGMEHAPYYVTDGNGVAFVLGGLNTTTRDNARFGQMMLQGGEWNGKQIVPRDWVDASTKASAKTAPGEIGYGYQWWVPLGCVDGQFLARGIYGQYIYIDQINNVTIAAHSADRAFRTDGVSRENEVVFQQIAESLATHG